jgi:hypothetical protein
MIDPRLPGPRPDPRLMSREALAREVTEWRYRDDKKAVRRSRDKQRRRARVWRSWADRMRLHATVLLRSLPADPLAAEHRRILLEEVTAFGVAHPGWRRNGPRH